ncbi:MAG: ABC transporter ATP-binding protein [Candidatus Fermentibacteraceae bacterium]
MAAPGTVEFRDVALDYRIYHDRTLSLMESVMNLFGRSSSSETFRALDGLTFAVAPGESVAIIGPNGAGKSTTLKLLAGIYEPTSGTVSSVGRTASLLDLGVGFHPELTGAENVYLNGALLGLGRARMEELLPEIAEFAQLERFMDSPVKYYSSGMFMRLGFSLATSVDPDILLVDEVLAVGDASFQSRCYDRIYSYRGSGRTIVFVSHDMEAVSRLCGRVIWLDRGKVVRDGSPGEVLPEYLSSSSRRRAEDGSVAPREWGSREVWFDRVELTDSTGTPRRRFRAGERLLVRALIRARGGERVEDIVWGFSIHRTDGETVVGVNNLELNRPLLTVEGSLEAELEIGLEVPEPGNYLLGLALTDPVRRRDYHWLDYHFPLELLGPRRTEPVRLVDAEWRW